MNPPPGMHSGRGVHAVLRVRSAAPGSGCRRLFLSVQLENDAPLCCGGFKELYSRGCALLGGQGVGRGLPGQAGQDRVRVLRLQQIHRQAVEALFPPVVVVRQQKAQAPLLLAQRGDIALQPVLSRPGEVPLYAARPMSLTTPLSPTAA